MSDHYLNDEHLDQIDFTSRSFEPGEYEYCTFTNCNFAEVDLTGTTFVDCEFRNCNLSNANLSSCAFRTVRFTDCKLLGLRWDTCNKFGFDVSFAACQLNHSSFFQMIMKKTSITNCSLEGVDFAETDLSEAKITECNLLNATFDATLLERADLRGSVQLQIDPDVNRIRGMRVSKSALAGFLGKYQIQVDED